jgi:DNA-binding CsgD family transcriptional regulator
MRFERVRDEILRLSHRGLDVRGFSLAAAGAVRRAVPFDGVCVLTMDPATLLPTGHVIENGLPDSTMARYVEIEIREADVNKFVDLARARMRAATLSAATGGRLDRSTRHRELRGPNGFADELRAVFVDAGGTWGGIILLREAGTADFTLAHARLLDRLSPHLADGLRRAMLLTALSQEEAEAGTGLLVLGDGGEIRMADAAARAWLDDLGADARPASRLPLAIEAVALRARDVAAGRAPAGASVHARVRARSGRWVLVRGTTLDDASGARPAVMLEQARPHELAPLIADAYGLTERERVLTQLVAQGYSTAEISARLYLSAWTVQDHLKAIFEKVGVSSRGALVARLFFEHYAPRLSTAA